MAAHAGKYSRATLLLFAARRTSLRRQHRKCGW
jgi:hypothetical protein